MELLESVMTSVVLLDACSLEWELLEPFNDLREPLDSLGVASSSTFLDAFNLEPDACNFESDLREPLESPNALPKRDLFFRERYEPFIIMASALSSCNWRCW